MAGGRRILRQSWREVVGEYERDTVINIYVYLKMS